MKKSWLIFVFVILCAAFGVTAIAEEVPDVSAYAPQEWLENPDRQVEFPELYLFYEKVIESVGGETAVQKWKAVVNTDDVPGRKANRDDGVILAFLAAEALEYTSYNVYDADRIPYDFCFAEAYMFDVQSQLNYDYPYINTGHISQYWEDGTRADDGTADVPFSAVMWMLRRMDLENQVYLLDYEGEQWDFHLDEPFTGEAAIQCMQRFVATKNKPSYLTANYAKIQLRMKMEQEEDYGNPEDKEEQEILVDAEKWLKDFQNRRQDAECVGTAYYVSNSGSDENDGLSPDAAFATLEKALEAPFKEGDWILLERGSSWRMPTTEGGFLTDSVNLPVGVSIGAYGEGERPVISGAAEDGSDPENWQLYSEENGGKIWVFHRKVRDANVMVFNDGEAWADRVIPCLTANGYSDNQGNPFNIPMALSRDMTFCVMLDVSDLAIGDDLAFAVCLGELYLRCDAGNPAEVFDEVAIPQVTSSFAVQENSTVTGICIKYFTSCGVGVASYDRMLIEGERRFEDNELAWCGGLISNYQPTDYLPEGVYIAYCAGGGIQASGHDITISGNYIHDCAPMTTIISMHVDNDQLELYDYNNIVIRDNFFYRCGTALHWGDYTRMDADGSQGLLSQCVFENNRVLYSGYGWAGGLIYQLDRCHDPFYACIDGQTGTNMDGVHIRNNVFYLSRHALIYSSDFIMTGGENYDTFANERPIYEENLFVQKKDLPFAIFNDQPMDAEGFLAEMGDNTSEYTIVD